MTSTPASSTRCCKPAHIRLGDCTVPESPERFDMSPDLFIATLRDIYANMVRFMQQHYGALSGADHITLLEAPVMLDNYSAAEFAVRGLGDAHPSIRTRLLQVVLSRYHFTLTPRGFVVTPNSPLALFLRVCRTSPYAAARQPLFTYDAPRQTDDCDIALEQQRVAA